MFTANVRVAPGDLAPVKFEYCGSLGPMGLEFTPTEAREVARWLNSAADAAERADERLSGGPQ